MAVLEQQQGRAAQVVRPHGRLLRQRVVRRHGQHEGLVVERALGEVVHALEQREHAHVDLARAQLREHRVGLVFVEHQLQARQGLAEPLCDHRQQVGPDRRQERHAQPARQRVAVGPGDLDDFVAGLGNGPRAREDLLAGRRQHDAARLALDQRHPEVFLELAQLGREGRLAHVAALGGLAEVTRVGQRHEVLEVFQLEVGHSRSIHENYRG